MCVKVKKETSQWGESDFQLITCLNAAGFPTEIRQLVIQDDASFGREDSGPKSE